MWALTTPLRETIQRLKVSGQAKPWTRLESRHLPTALHLQDPDPMAPGADFHLAIVNLKQVHLVPALLAQDVFLHPDRGCFVVAPSTGRKNSLAD